MAAQTRAAVDLNADLGEGVGDDEALLELVTSANVACGFHAGDERTMRVTCAAAVERGVVIGAHVGYRDHEGFGRRETGQPPGQIERETAEQLSALIAAAGAGGGEVRYVKPHGALYHRCAGDRPAADALVRAVAASRLRFVLGPPGSALLASAGDAGLTPVAEGFADRRYSRADGPEAVAGLLDRGLPGALLQPGEAVEQAVLLARSGVVVTQDGARVAVKARSICVHGDTPAAAVLARSVRDALERAGVELAPFA